MGQLRHSRQRPRTAAKRNRGRPPDAAEGRRPGGRAAARRRQNYPQGGRVDFSDIRISPAPARRRRGRVAESAGQPAPGTVRTRDPQGRDAAGRAEGAAARGARGAARQVRLHRRRQGPGRSAPGRGGRRWGNLDHHRGPQRGGAGDRRRGDAALSRRAGAGGRAAGPVETAARNSAMLSRIFIDRPIFAAVLSLFIVLAGLAAMRMLPIAQYPEIAPPVVTVRAVYPGAIAQVIEQTVAAPLENQINGVENMIYMSSSSTSNGVVQIQVTFDIGTDVDRRGGQRQQPRQAGRAAAAPGGPAPGRHGGEGLLGVPAGARVLLARTGATTTSSLSNYVDDERARPAQARARHHQRADLRRQGLRDAHLAAARPPGPAPHHGAGRDPRDATSRTRSSPPARSARPRRRAASSSCTRSPPAAASPTPRQFGNIIVRAEPDGSACG